MCNHQINVQSSDSFLHKGCIFSQNNHFFSILHFFKLKGGLEGRGIIFGSFLRKLTKLIALSVCFLGALGFVHLGWEVEIFILDECFQSMFPLVV